MSFLSKWAPFALGLFVMLPIEAFAVPITFTHRGASSATGTLDGNAFTTAAFVIEAAGDTANRFAFAGGFFIDHDSASITIPGVGQFDFITPTRTFINGSTIGFSRGSVGGLDLFNGPTVNALAGYDLLSAIGPINGTAELLQWSSLPVVTSGGVLVFNDDTIQAKFRADLGGPVAVSEPGMLGLIGFGMIAIGMARRRRMA